MHHFSGSPLEQLGLDHGRFEIDEREAELDREGVVEPLLVDEVVLEQDVSQARLRVGGLGLDLEGPGEVVRIERAELGQQVSQAHLVAMLAQGLARLLLGGVAELDQDLEQRPPRTQPLGDALGVAQLLGVDDFVLDEEGTDRGCFRFGRGHPPSPAPQRASKLLAADSWPSTRASSRPHSEMMYGKSSHSKATWSGSSPMR